MMRNACLALLGLALGLAVVGCGKSDGPRTDMPVKGSAGVDKKGKATRTFEATLEDPAAKKK